MAGLFFGVIRDQGHTDPSGIVRAVEAELKMRIERAQHWPDDDKVRRWTRFLNIVALHREVAREYAAHAVAWNAMPADEKARIKAERQPVYAMRGKPATDRQVEFLRSLGHEGDPPQDRAHASELIEKLLRSGGDHAWAP
jgi:hypothetical protein